MLQDLNNCDHMAHNYLVFGPTTDYFKALLLKCLVCIPLFVPDQNEIISCENINQVCYQVQCLFQLLFCFHCQTFSMKTYSLVQVSFIIVDTYKQFTDQLLQILLL